MNRAVDLIDDLNPIVSESASALNGVVYIGENTISSGPVGDTSGKEIRNADIVTKPPPVKLTESSINSWVTPPPDVSEITISPSLTIVPSNVRFACCWTVITLSFVELTN